MIMISVNTQEIYFYPKVSTGQHGLNRACAAAKRAKRLLVPRCRQAVQPAHERPPAHRPNSYPTGKLLLTCAHRASIVSRMDNHSPRLDNVFSALADPTRRAIVARLSEGEASVGELAQPFDMALPSLMKHIRVLETGGLVQSEKHGRVRTCRLMPDAMKGAETWLAEQRSIWHARFDRLEAYVERLEKKPPRRRHRD